MRKQFSTSRLQFVRVCDCGCGRPTLLATTTDDRYGYVYKQPMPFHCRRCRTSIPNEYRIEGDTAYLALTDRAGVVVAEAIIDASDLMPARTVGRWYASRLKAARTYYVTAHASKQQKVFLHRVVLDVPEGLLVDHKNHNGLDCRKDNLRIATPTQNGQNRRGADRDGRLGIRNVYWRNASRKWGVQMVVDGKHLHFGLYADLEEAKRVAEEKRRELMPFAA